MSRRAQGWLPRQHGAWAMLVLPYCLGVVLAVRAGTAGPHLVPLFAFWMLGYFAFHAASGWLKAPAVRRGPWVKPLVTYAAASALCGLATLALGGWAMAGWVPFYLPLLLPALWLASRRRERDTAGGALTVAAASAMTLVARYPAPADLAADPGAWTPLVVSGLVFAYFFGTVLYVKTNIRERGSRAFHAVSVGWHAAATLACVALAVALAWPWWWAAFFAVTTARAALVPSRHWTARRIGVVESLLCVVLVVAFVAW